MNNEVHQEKNVVSDGGNQAARDINQTYNIQNQVASDQTRIQKLINRFEKEYQEDDTTNDTIEGLKRYQDPVDPNTLSLKEKLKKGQREDNYVSAIEKKEAFSKKLAEFQFYRSAQKLFVAILHEMEAKYELKIKPLIIDNKDRKEVDSHIYDEIIDPTAEKITSVDLFITQRDVMGMMYYLASKCIIQWHKD